MKALHHQMAMLHEPNPSTSSQGCSRSSGGKWYNLFGRMSSHIAKTLLSPLKVPTMKVKKDNFPLFQVQRKSGRKFIWNSAWVKRSRTPFLKKYVLTLLYPIFLQLFFIIINTQRHFQVYINFTPEYCQSQFPESDSEILFFVLMVTESVKLHFFLILRCQMTLSVVALHSFSKFWFFCILKLIYNVILLTQDFPPKKFLNRNHSVRTYLHWMFHWVHSCSVYLYYT